MYLIYTSCRFNIIEMLLGKKHSKPQQQHSCRECQMEYMLEDVATINQRLRLLDEMYS